MAVDASIPLQVKPAQFMNPQQAMSLQQLALQTQAQQQDMADKNELRNVGRNYSDEQGGITPEGLKQISNPIVRNQLLVQQQQMLAQGVAAKLAKLNLSDKQNDLMSDALVGVYSDAENAKKTLAPEQASQRFIESLRAKTDELKRSGNFSPEQLSALDRVQTPQDLVALLSGSKALKEYKAQFAPKVEGVDLGGSRQFVDTNPMSNPDIVGTTLKKTPTIGEQETGRHNLESEATARGNLDVNRQQLTQGWARINIERQKMNQEKLGNPTEVTVNGVPTLGAFDKQTRSWIDAGTGQRITGNVQPKADDTQRTAAGYAARMDAAEQVMGMNTGGEKPGVVESAAGGVPLVGKILQNIARPEERQKYRQAQEDWVRAKLRKESGAVIADEEMDREIRTYFPQIGDGEGVIRQKADARAQATKGLKAAAGAALPSGTGKNGGKIARPTSKPPAGVEQSTWDHMTPEERKLFQ